MQSALAANGIEGKTASSNIEDKEIDIVKKYLTPKKEERMPQEKKNNEKRAEQPQGNEKRVEKKQESAQGTDICGQKCRARKGRAYAPGEKAGTWGG